MTDVRCPLCGCVIGGASGIPDVPVRYYCQKCKREITIETRQKPLEAGSWGNSGGQVSLGA